MTIKQMRMELLQLGYPVDDFSDQKVKRIHPKAIVSYDEMYEDLMRREFPMEDMCEETIKRMYRRYVGFEFPWCQKFLVAGLWDDKYPHRKNGDAICQDESFY